jgi:hypothetical protein
MHSEALRVRCVRSVLARLPEEALVWMAVDNSPLERPESATSDDRGDVHVSNLPLCDTPVRIGWSFSLVALLAGNGQQWDADPGRATHCQPGDGHWRGD